MITSKMFTTQKVKYYDSVAAAIVDLNPQYRKLLLPETVKQAPAIENSISAMKLLGTRCGLKIKGRFPEEIIKYEKKLKYLKQNKYSDALKQFMEIYTRYSKQGPIGDILLKLKLPAEAKKILEAVNLKGFKI